METSGEQAACRNCGHELAGAFCAACGEPRPSAREWSWRHFVHDAMHEFLHVDAKIVRTIGLLLFRPGFLTAEYWDGRRTSYIRPLRLYIVMAAIHLLAMSATVYRLDFFRASDSSGKFDKLLASIAAKHHTTPEAAAAALDGKFQKAYAITQYFAVLGYAVVPLWIYRRRRPHYVQHLIFSLNVYAAYFVFSSVMVQTLTPAQWRAGPSMLVLLVYLYFAVRRLYGEGVAISMGKALLLRAGQLAAEFLAIAFALASAILLTWRAGAH